MFTRRESFKEYITYYPVVSMILLIHLILYLLTNLPIFPNKYLLETMMGVNLYIVEGEWWRLITPIFIHGGFAHLLFNSFSIFLFGPALERILGKFKFLLIYVVTGIAANIITLLIEPLTYVHLGSSGAIFGLFGYYISLVVFRKDIISQSNAQIITTIAVLSLIMTFLQPNINIVAHIFGFLTGVIVGSLSESKGKKIFSSYKEEWYYLRQQLRRTKKPEAKSIIIWIIIFGLAIIGFVSQ
ncbi:MULTISPECIES: rhomboid family intramembrane serine protease [unclassified Niallia]|uniref:rhomboid family intramembrane serine protease n=1 Tax=unclassified Niallia TaxID=2837522 RepID=UPI0013D49289